MATEITMPRLSDQMEEGTVLRWIKGEGDEVAKGDDLVEIETDKATWVVEAEAAGHLLQILVGDGQTAPVGGSIALIGSPGEVAPGSEPAAADAGDAAPAQPNLPELASKPAPTPRARATPVARRTAAELRISLEVIAGTGPNGRIVRRDVVAAAANGRAKARAEAAGRGSANEVALSSTQRTIARRMLESTSSIPHFTVTIEIEMDAAVALRADLRQLTPERVPSMNDLVVKAAALALRDHPRLNASYDGERLTEWPRINVGVAVATEDALLVPVVFDADRKSLAEISQETADLIRRAQGRQLTPADLADGTFTVSNLGMFGVRNFTAVVNPPQAAILAVGEVARRPVVTAEGELAARHLVEATLSSDHRIVYGADAARFLGRLRELLERPLSLTL